uniref:Uncharacterized protein n=1 Tax=Ditylenchus dipsaci TaxID=166011 RepID=A0A915D900_9BILA
MVGTSPFNPRMPPPTSTMSGGRRNGGMVSPLVSPTTPLSGQKRRFSDSNPGNGNEEEGGRPDSAQPGRKSFTEKRGNWKKQPEKEGGNHSFDAGRQAQQSRGFLFE